MGFDVVERKTFSFQVGQPENRKLPTNKDSMDNLSQIVIFTINKKKGKAIFKSSNIAHYPILLIS